MRYKSPVFAAILSVVLLFSVSEAQVISLNVDASEITRRIIHAQMTFPEAEGEFAVLYPKWIPGHHRPAGPIDDLVGIMPSVDGQPIKWHRDNLDMYRLVFSIPKGRKGLKLNIDFICSPESAGASVTDRLAMIVWNKLLLYPDGGRMDEVMFAPSITLPDGWKYGSALQPESPLAGNKVSFQAVSLERLIDSPILCGANYRQVDITPDGMVPHYIEIFADNPEDLKISESQIAAHTKMVSEARAMFGVRHYNRYHFLLALSDNIAIYGLEHHESSDDRGPENHFTDKDAYTGWCHLLPHEYIHSWNGKYRRPDGMYTPDYHQPKDTNLLWVYEGLTTYYTFVLTSRSGFWDEGIDRQSVACTANWVENRRGREWLPLKGTTDAAPFLYSARTDWANWRRGVDFYREGALLWLEIDCRIRTLTGGKKTLDDFSREFFGGGDSGPMVKPYTFDDVISALNDIAAFDWEKLIRSRIESTGENAIPDGIELSGWQLSYTDKKEDFIRIDENGGADLSGSLGVEVMKDGVVYDIVPGKAADRAGLASGVKIIAVDGRAFSPAVIDQAVKLTAGDKSSVELITERDGFYKTVTVEYSGGLKYPTLTRIEGTPDILSEIFKPLTK